MAGDGRAAPVAATWARCTPTHAPQRPPFTTPATPARSLLWRWQVLVGTAMLGAHRCGPRLEICYRPLPGVRAELEELVTAEARHNPCLTWTLDQHHSAGDGADTEGHLVVGIAASTEHPDDIAVIALLVNLQLVTHAQVTVRPALGCDRQGSAVATQAADPAGLRATS